MIQSEHISSFNQSNQIEPVIQLRPEEKAKIKYRASLISTLGNLWPDYLVTLTFRRPIKRDLFDKIVKDFTFRLHNELYGRKSSKAASTYLFCEYKTSENLHLHMFIKDPVRTMSPEKLKEFNYRHSPRFLSDVIRACWIAAGEPYGCITGDPRTTSKISQWFKDVECPFEAADYCTKEIRYGNNDLVLWEHSTPHGRRLRKKRSITTN